MMGVKPGSKMWVSGICGGPAASHSPRGMHPAVEDSDGLCLGACRSSAGGTSYT